VAFAAIVREARVRAIEIGARPAGRIELLQQPEGSETETVDAPNPKLIQKMRQSRRSLECG
jgi:hypothetical protein